MFTGIVEAVGHVESVTPRGESVRLSIREPRIAPELGLGDSVAVNGACLTVAETGSEVIAFDAIAETLEKTALGHLEAGSKVNLERAMRADGRFDGHIVQGHVDECGQVRELRRDGEDVRLFIRTSAAFAGLLVEKGSVTIQGVSLTVVDVAPDGFDVALIPHTLAVTTLGELGSEDPVNLEADVLGKYVQRYLARTGAAPAAS